MRRTFLTAALVSLLIATATPAAGQWVRVESPHFVVFGETGEAHTREYAADFERFREAIGRLIPGAGVRPTVPALPFRKDKDSFAPYRPLYRGKPVDVNVIMLPISNRQPAMRTILHESSHLVAMNISRGLPLWLAEGLAEYYSPFELQADGRRAVVGGIIDTHLIRLSRDRMLPLEELVATGLDSPLYNEGARRSTFYAQSWALVHMLLSSTPARKAEFDRYVSLTHAGRPALDACREVLTP